MFTDDFAIGKPVLLRLLVSDDSGQFFDPETIRLIIQPPGIDPIIIDAPAHLATGHFQHIHWPDKKGTWYYRWEIGAPIPDAAEGSFTVQPSRLYGKV